jgi:Zinc finger, C3HC4 type (RING finger)
MDAVKALQQIHKEFTECSLCADQFVSPKVLPCLHTFCLPCLERYGKGKRIQEPITCPICRQEFTLQQGGFAALPNNFHTNRLIELQQSFEKSYTNAQWCQVCSAEGKEGAACMNPTDGYCTDCEKGVCTSCASKHTDDGHCVKRKPNNVCDPGIVTKPVTDFCQEHTSELLKLYCLECSSVVCVKCFCRSHNTHKCCDIEDAAEKFDQEIGVQLKNLRATASNIKHLLAQYTRKIQSVSENTAQMEREIKEAAEKLKRSIDRNKTVLIQELKTKTQPALSQMQNYRTVLDTRLAAISGLIDEVEKAHSGGHQLKIQLSNKLSADKSRFEVPSSPEDSAVHKQYYFFPSTYDDTSIPGNNLVGCIVDCDAGKALQVFCLTVWPQTPIY